MMLSTWTNPESCKALGNLVVKTKNGTRTIHDVHYFSDSNVSLLSLVVFNKRGFDLKNAGVKQLVVTKGNKEVLSFQRNGPLYQLEGVCVPPDRVLAVADIDVRHRRMGHASAAKLHQLSQSGFAMPNLKGQTLGACSVCMESNLRRQSFNKEKVQVDLRDTVSVDLNFFGVTSHDGYTCAFNLVTHTHRLSYVVPLKHKSEALAAFKPFFQYYKRQQDTSIKHVKCDGGGEFAGQFKTFLDEQGVELHVTPRATPQLNGVAERTGGILGSMVRAMLKDAGLSKGYWSDALKCAAYLRNRLPATFLQGKTPIEAFLGRAPNMAYVHRFGQICFALTDSKRKLNDRGIKCILLGFNSLGYRVMGLDSRQVVYRRHLFEPHPETLDAHDYVCDTDSPTTVPDGVASEGKTRSASRTSRDPSAASTAPSTPIDDPLFTTQDPLTADIHESSAADGHDSNADSNTDSTADGDASEPDDTYDAHDDDDYLAHDSDLPPVPPFDEEDPLDSQDSSADAETAPRTHCPVDPPSTQYDRRGSKRLLDDEDDSDDVKQHPSRSKRLMTLAQRYSEGFSMAVVDMCFLVEGTPRNYNEAVEGPEASKWTKAIDEELAALIDYGTREETDVVPKRALDTTWVFKIKTDKDGNVARRKARLVIRGYMHIPGVDFGDTYAPVARVNSMRCVLAIAATIDYEIYIKRPQGSKATTRYLKLLKSLYGLRQSPRCWNTLLDKTLKTFGFVAAPSDPCLYIHNSGDAYLVVYVDDLSQTGYIFLLGDNPVSWRSVKQTLVAASTVEAEYIALNSAVSEALYLQQLLHQLKVLTKTVTLFEDNMGAIHLAKNPVHHDGTKHFDIRLHRVRDYIEKKEGSGVLCANYRAASRWVDEATDWREIQ
ncbi:hypothetical protein Ae201684_011790 [Aphanomyces euteiches]|uniref:Integrase catalytic domain-containing protein n=1 Tax=Aphanomyces euteiches TaxID=100861 RepID=A0A6G0WTV0_9STRA|nr:hypothetical protein Ae201684_011790 [Aphanomyces euteiches]